MLKNFESHILGIKHMAFAVENIEKTLTSYKKFLGVSNSVEIMDMPKSGGIYLISDSKIQNKSCII